MSARPPARAGAPARALIVLGALSGLVSILLGAMQAHAFGDLAAAGRKALETAIAYQQLHALALLAAGTLSALGPNPWLHAAGGLFAAGSLLFCGTIYLESLAGFTALGRLTPVGGVALMVGWLALALGAWRLTRA